MINYSGSFSDLHGITHIDPVFLIRTASINSSDHTVVNYDFEAGAYVSTPGSYHSLSYEVVYWTSESAKEEGKMPVTFTPTLNDTAITFQPESVGDLIPQCEAHFTELYL